jgi:predicted neutral ceramidase superfamily lipid hydrolase
MESLKANKSILTISLMASLIAYLAYNSPILIYELWSGIPLKYAIKKISLFIAVAVLLILNSFNNQ